MREMRLTLDDAGDRARVTEVSVGDRVTGQNGGEELGDLRDFVQRGHWADRSLASKHAREHRDAVFGERIEQVATSTTTNV